MLLVQLQALGHRTIFMAEELLQRMVLLVLLPVVLLVL